MLRQRHQYFHVVVVLLSTFDLCVLGLPNDNDFATKDTKNGNGEEKCYDNVTRPYQYFHAVVAMLSTFVSLVSL